MSATHFITAPAFHRKRIFQNQRYGDLFAETLMRFRQDNAVLIHDYVIMPDHVHLLLTVHGDVSGAAALQKLQETFAHELKLQYGYAGEVWETSFHNKEIKTPEECALTVKKIHSNPVRVGFCEQPGQYRMSSKSSHWVLDPLPEGLRQMQSA
jgi:putative transposase